MKWSVSDIPRGRGQIHLRIQGPVARLVLDNPAARNAMSVGMMADLVRAVEQLESSKVRAVLLSGSEGGGFCAGGDLRDVREHLLNEEAAQGMQRSMGDALDRLSSLPAVVVASVEGAALGGGAELLTAADWVVASRDARVGFVHAALGVSPGWGGGRRLIRRVGRKNASIFLLQAKRHTAEEAERLGLVDLVVDNGDADAEALDWLDAILRHPEASVAGVLQILRAGREEFGSVAQIESAVFSRLWGGNAHRAALNHVKVDE